MNMKTHILFVIGITRLAAQSQGGFSPVPTWSDSLIGKTSPADRDFVFLDLKSGEYIVQFPSTVAGLAANRFRVELQNLGNGTVKSSITTTKPGLFEYSYAVTNNANARRAIETIYLVGASSDASAVLTHPSWFASGSSPTQALAAPQIGLTNGEFKRSATMGRYLFWSAGRNGSPIGAGVSAAGFTIQSNHRPGWTTVFYAAGKGIALPAEAASMPVGVMEKLEELQRPENYFTRGITIGPKFGPSVGDHWIASDWLLGIEMMSVRSLLNPRSPYINELTVQLRRIVEQSDGPPATFSLKAKPQSPPEVELDSAIRLALPIR